MRPWTAPVEGPPAAGGLHQRPSPWSVRDIRVRQAYVIEADLPERAVRVVDALRLVRNAGIARARLPRGAAAHRAADLLRRATNLSYAHLVARAAGSSSLKPADLVAGAARTPHARFRFGTANSRLVGAARRGAALVADA
jgi:hypothetical protein